MYNLPSPPNIHMYTLQTQRNVNRLVLIGCVSKRNDYLTASSTFAVTSLQTLASLGFILCRLVCSHVTHHVIPICMGESVFNVFPCAHVVFGTMYSFVFT